MIGDNLKKLREREKINKRQMAEILGLPYTTYNNYEIGVRDPGSDFLIKISKIFNVSVDYLLGREDNVKYLESQKHFEKYNELDSDSKIIINSLIDLEHKQTRKRADELTLSEQEKELIKQIRGFDESVRNDLLKYISDLYEDRDEIPNTENEIEEKAN